MKLGIMQPYFFPYLGYFNLIQHTDRWIVFDTVQYIRHGWMNRNRILKPASGWQYIIVPLRKHSRETLIRDIIINNKLDWKKRILRQFEHYKRIAPYYLEVVEFLEICFEFETDSLVHLNHHLLGKTCEYLKINYSATVLSEMTLDINEVNDPGGWALQISRAMGASQYINPVGGKGLFDNKLFRENGIELRFMQTKLCEYDQRRNHFEPGLSILDVMAFNSKEKIRKFLNDGACS